MASTLPKLPIFEAIASHPPRSLAIVHSASNESFTYDDLLKDIAGVRNALTDATNGQCAKGERVAFLAPNGYSYVVTLLSILSVNAIAVPLCPTFPASELRYVLDQSQSKFILYTRDLERRLRSANERGLEHVQANIAVESLLQSPRADTDVELAETSDTDAGMILYTSGTNSRPKGVLLPLTVLNAQANSLREAWAYSPHDRLLHLLPLHHIHGVVNALLTPLFAGSVVEFLSPFNATPVWERLGAPFTGSREPEEKITFLTMVPTMYNRLLQSHESLSDELRSVTKQALTPEHLRLNISGSAALPTPTKKAWADISGGNILLERYGMTEVGMALSCGLDFADRVDGSVGWPLPSVEVRLVDTETNEVIVEGEELDNTGKERQGEIQIRGPTVFREYWANPEATASEFVDGEDGKGKWFKTGDIAVRRLVDGAGNGRQPWAKGPMYFIQGRKSADIFKTGGEKVSALEVERELLSLPEVSECAVVGLPSEVWGQKIAAVVVLTSIGKESGRGGKPWTAMDMRRALRDRLANYKIPQEMKVVDEIPRNAMGKINKGLLAKEVFRTVNANS